MSTLGKYTFDTTKATNILYKHFDRHGIKLKIELNASCLHYTRRTRRLQNRYYFPFPSSIGYYHIFTFHTVYLLSSRIEYGVTVVLEAVRIRYETKRKRLPYIACLWFSIRMDGSEMLCYMIIINGDYTFTFIGSIYF